MKTLITLSAVLLVAVLILLVGLFSQHRSLHMSWQSRYKDLHLETGYVYKYSAFPGLEISGRFYRFGPMVVVRRWHAQSDIVVTNGFVPARNTRVF